MAAEPRAPPEVTHLECRTLERGWWLALTLHRDTAPLRCYAGQVCAVDERGVRLAMIDWQDGSASDIHIFVPWSSIASAMVVTESDALDQFERRAGDWQAHCSALGGEFDRELARGRRGSEGVRAREGPKAP